MPRPNLVDTQYDDLQYRFGSKTYDGLNLNPTAPHNPLHTYKMTQLDARRREVNKNEGKKYIKLRRLSHVKRRFSTVIEPKPINTQRMFFNSDTLPLWNTLDLISIYM